MSQSNEEPNEYRGDEESTDDEYSDSNNQGASEERVEAPQNVPPLGDMPQVASPIHTLAQQLKSILQQNQNHQPPQQNPQYSPLNPWIHGQLLQQQLSQQASPDTNTLLANLIALLLPPAREPAEPNLQQAILSAAVKVLQYQILSQYLRQALSQNISSNRGPEMPSCSVGFAPIGMPAAQLLQQPTVTAPHILSSLCNMKQPHQQDRAKGSANSTPIAGQGSIPTQQLQSLLSHYQSMTCQRGSTGSENSASIVAQRPIASSSGATAASARQSTLSNDDSQTSLPVRKKRKYEHESFPEKLHRLLTDAHSQGNQHIICFIDDGEQFQILKASLLEEEILPRYFRHNRISSFKRLLRMYAFQRVQGTWNEGIFHHPLFHRDHPEWCKQIHRSESKGT